MLDYWGGRGDVGEDCPPVPALPLEPSVVVAQLVGGRRLQRAAECDELAWITEWADLHPGEGVPNRRVPGAERAVRVGAIGTPLVAEFAPSELGVHLGCSAYAARQKMADALEVRHRLRQIWARVVDGEVDAWQVRKIAQATRHLSADEAAWVDGCVVGHLGLLSAGRLLSLLDAKVIEANPQLAAEAAAQARSSGKKVHVGQSDEHGLTTMYARVEAADALWLDGMIDRVAQALARQGDTSSADERRSTAMGMLANPATVIQLLHADATVPNDPEPDGPEPSSPEPDGTEPDGSESDGSGPGLYDEPVDGGDLFSEPEPSQVPPLALLSKEAIAVLIAQINPTLLMPTIKLTVHIAGESLDNGTGVVRVEGIRGLGPMVTDVVRAWLAHAHVTTRPVIDLSAGCTPVDSWEVPRRMREILYNQQPVSSFPFSAGKGSTDAHHNRPFVHDGPPGQTWIGNLTPMVKFEHRVITHGRWADVRQPWPGTLLYRAPHGHIFLVDHNGTHALGNTSAAAAVWHAAAPTNAC